MVNHSLRFQCGPFFAILAMRCHKTNCRFSENILTHQTGYGHTVALVQVRSWVIVFEQQLIWTSILPWIANKKLMKPMWKQMISTCLPMLPHNKTAILCNNVAIFTLAHCCGLAVRLNNHNLIVTFTWNGLLCMWNVFHFGSFQTADYNCTFSKSIFQFNLHILNYDNINISMTL